MRYSSKTTEKLVNYYKEISLLNKVNGVLDWDLNVNLPPKASESRGMQRAYITKLIAEKWQSTEFKNTLEKAQAESQRTVEEKAIVRNLTHAAKFYHRVPKEIIVEFSETTSVAFMAWREAREQNKFKIFEPHLKKIVHLNQIIAGHMGFEDNAYDALLGVYEPGLTAAECKQFFATLIEEIGKLLAKIKKSPVYKETENFSKMEYPRENQEKIANFVLTKIGYDFEAGRQDISAHPFTTELGAGDVRITNRYNPHNFIESIMVAMHEGGHALYEQGVNRDFENTPLEGGVSLGIHESQSRFWENQVGRSRAFINYLEPVLRSFYPEQLAKVNKDALYLAFNRVSPSLIRVEADEVTYNLHVALRFELEEALMNEKIKVHDLPEVWRDRMKKYLGVVPKTDSDGVLQDVHWSYGNFGYFPTYTLGNLYAAQLTHFMKKEVNAGETVEQGELGAILSWERQNIHKYGSLYWPAELIKKITNEPLNSKYFIKYLNQKYSEIYNLN